MRLHFSLILPGLSLLLLNSSALAQDKDSKNSFMAEVRSGKMECPIDQLAAIPDVWELTPDDLDKAFGMPAGVDMKKNPKFSWMTKNRDRAVFMRKPYGDLEVNLTIFEKEIPVEEVVVDFVDGKLNGISFSIYNKGDSSSIGHDEFDRRFKFVGKKMSDMIGVRPRNKKAKPTQGLLAEGWVWKSAQGMAALEMNPEASEGDAEFLRLKIAPNGATGPFAAAFQNRSYAVKLSDLPDSIAEDGDDIYIKGIPMVDQGQKGYCVVASVQRLFEHYGIPADQHQLAQVAGTDADSGTNPMVMAKALDKIDYRFKTRFEIICMRTQYGMTEVNKREWTIEDKVDEDKFIKEVKKSIDDGIPVLWGLMLGMVPEEPAIAPQVGGGHMRMIIGYNDKDRKFIFTDSWGAGHEMKRMTYDNAYKSTLGLFVMKPTVR